MLENVIVIIHTLVIMSFKCDSRHASVGCAIMASTALSNSSYLSYRKTSSAHKWACSAARRTFGMLTLDLCKRFM